MRTKIRESLLLGAVMLTLSFCAEPGRDLPGGGEGKEAREHHQLEGSVSSGGSSEGDISPLGEVHEPSAVSKAHVKKEISNNQRNLEAGYCPSEMKVISKEITRTFSFLTNKEDLKTGSCLMLRRSRLEEDSVWFQALTPIVYGTVLRDDVLSHLENDDSNLAGLDFELFTSKGAVRAAVDAHGQFVFENAPHMPLTTIMECREEDGRCALIVTLFVRPIPRYKNESQDNFDLQVGRDFDLNVRTLSQSSEVSQKYQERLRQHASDLADNLRNLIIITQEDGQGSAQILLDARNDLEELVRREKPSSFLASLSTSDWLHDLSHVPAVLQLGCAFPSHRGELVRLQSQMLVFIELAKENEVFLALSEALGA